VVFSKNGKFIVSGSDDKSVIVWNAETGNLEKKLIGHGEKVSSVDFLPDGKYIVSSSFDNKIIIWSSESGQ
jgi:WD40 repeat protein